MEKKTSCGAEYLTIIAKVASQLNWLTFSVLIIIGTTLFMLYDYHFGELNSTVLRITNNTKPENLKIINEARANKGLPSITADDAKAELDKFKELQRDAELIILPIIGVKFTKQDFILLYLLMGCIFLFWVFTLLSYIYNFLENLVNEFNYPSDKDANIILSSLFLLNPAEFASKQYKYYELIFVLFMGCLVLFTISNLSDLFYNPLGIPLIQNPSFSIMLRHLIFSYLIIIFCTIITILIFKKSKAKLKHIRNCLILLRWNRTAFFPILYKLSKEKIKKELKKDKNFIEYRITDNTGSIKLSLILDFEEDKSLRSYAARVDLSKSLREFYQAHKNEFNKTEFYGELNRNLTVEEYLMRKYFEVILTDPAYEENLYQISPFADKNI